MNDLRLISVAGWEERFSLGLLRNLTQYLVRKVDLFVYFEYKKHTYERVEAAHDLCVDHNCILVTHSLYYENPVFTWKYLQKWVETNIVKGEAILLDITTMPRETVWSLLFFLEQRECKIQYIYWSPEDYSNQWLCNEPSKPRLLFKHSGISEFDKNTALVILTGFDTERTAQLVFYYEPKLTVLGIQAGKQFSNNSRNSLKYHEDECKGSTTIESFELDAYKSDHGLDVLKSTISPLLHDYNVIVSSLGPKLSAIAVYQLQREFPSIALTYVPTKEYNLFYSRGIGESVTGIFTPPSSRGPNSGTE